MADTLLNDNIKKRRTFAIISHPDAGKTTLTEKFLLYGGAINLAGSVKGRKAARHAVSDWMEIEKERGISVTSSVLQFNYDNYCINILDTPGHEDFSEDTYRTLMAADSAVMVIDASKGVERQTTTKSSPHVNIRLNSVRLACLMCAASVSPEPGSNSQIKLSFKI